VWRGARDMLKDVEEMRRKHLGQANKGIVSSTMMQMDICLKNNVMKLVVMTLLICVGGMTLANSPARADARQLLGSYRDWDAFLLKKQNNEKICYMISVPKDTHPKNVRRGDIYITVKHRPRTKVKNEINVVVGYPFKKNSTSKVVIDKRSYTLFTSGDGAWAYDAKQDTAMAAAMKRGNVLYVHGVSSRGTKTKDKYSLSGFTAAHNAITKACR